jgi:phosphoribosylformimino-5-aminoimidazole carboxamide ribonucleotide (ProFAR) isomerase
MTASDRSLKMPSAPRESTPALIPCLLLQNGQVMLPGDEGPIRAIGSDGKPVDPFDVVDRLPAHSRLYVVDLDGVERGDPQVEYLQELARDLELWVDAGVRTSDQAIDIFVAGASRVTLSSVHLQGPAELEKAWKLSPAILFELEINSGGLSPVHPDWGVHRPKELAARIREIGPQELIVSPRGTDIDWNVVRELSEGGPVYVDGVFQRTDVERLRAAGGSAGIYHWTEADLQPSAD